MADYRASDLRSIAEERVRRRHERQRERLAEFQSEARYREETGQQNVLERAARREAALREELRLARERQELSFQKERERLALTPMRSGPAFGMGMAMPAGPSPAEQYRQLQRRQAERRELLEKRYRERLAALETARREQEKTFADQNRRREDAHQRSVNALKAQQEEEFERAVQKHMDRASHGIGVTFTRQVREPRREARPERDRD